MLLDDIDESMEIIKESAKQFDQLYALQQQFRQNPSDWEDMEKRKGRQRPEPGRYRGKNGHGSK